MLSIEEQLKDYINTLPAPPPPPIPPPPITIPKLEVKPKRVYRKKSQVQELKVQELYPLTVPEHFASLRVSKPAYEMTLATTLGRTRSQTAKMRTALSGVTKKRK